MNSKTKHKDNYDDINDEVEFQNINEQIYNKEISVFPPIKSKVRLQIRIPLVSKSPSDLSSLRS